MRSFASLPSHPYPPTLLLFLVFHLSVLSLSISVFSPRTRPSLSHLSIPTRTLRWSYTSYLLKEIVLVISTVSIYFCGYVNISKRIANIAEYLKTEREYDMYKYRISIRVLSSHSIFFYYHYYRIIYQIDSINDLLMCHVCHKFTGNLFPKQKHFYRFISFSIFVSFFIHFCIFILHISLCYL